MYVNPSTRISLGIQTNGSSIMKVLEGVMDVKDLNYDISEVWPDLHLEVVKRVESVLSEYHITNPNFVRDVLLSVHNNSVYNFKNGKSEYHDK